MITTHVPPSKRGLALWPRLGGLLVLPLPQQLPPSVWIAVKG